MRSVHPPRITPRSSDLATRLRTLLAAALLTGAPGCGKATAPEAAPAEQVRVRYEAQTLDGATFSLAARDGAFTLINVWATWCEPCVDEFPLLAELHRELHGPPFSVVAVSVDSARNGARVKAMVRDWELPFPVVHDPDNRIVTTLRVSGYPTSVLIGPRGVEVARREGALRGASGPFLSLNRGALEDHE